MPDTIDLNPQGREMADESMVRTLAAQAEAIWPQERPLFARYALPDAPEILDAGCGTGEITSRLAELYPRGRVLGVDIIEAHLTLAIERYASLGERVRFENRTVFGLALPEHSFDLTVCRHVIHSIPDAAGVVGELARVTRPGGRVHLIAEDYGMLHFAPRHGGLDPATFWHEAPHAFAKATGTDLHVGRNAYGLMLAAGLRDITVDYVIVDTLRVPRETFAGFISAWRDGYVSSIAEHTRFTAEQARTYFEASLAAIRDPERYAVWFVPVVAGRVP